MPLLDYIIIIDTMRLRLQPALASLAAMLGLAGRARGFVCPSLALCTAEDPADPVDECPDLGYPRPDGNAGEHCCRDGCPRNYCTAKQGASSCAGSCDASSDGPVCYAIAYEWGGTEELCGCGDDADCPAAAPWCGVVQSACDENTGTCAKLCSCNPANGDGCDPDGEAPHCGSAFTRTGLACRCSEDADCKTRGETCGAPSCISDVIPYCDADHDAGYCERTYDPTPSPGGAAKTDTYCLTEAECEEASQGYDSFTSGVFATAAKGCFSKNNKAFFARGTAEEMQETDLPGIQNRIRCDGSSGRLDGEEVACLTEEECRAASANRGFASFTPGEYPTKGCFSKRDNAFFSPGGEDAMSGTDLSGVQERLWCTYRKACLTVEDCRARSAALGFAQFEPGTYPTKGCFSKKDTVFFSPGTDEEMAEPDLPGVQERIFCDDAPLNFSAFALAPPASAPTVASSLSNGNPVLDAVPNDVAEVTEPPPRPGEDERTTPKAPPPSTEETPGTPEVSASSQVEPLNKAGAVSESDGGVISGGSTIRSVFTCISAVTAVIATPHLML